MALYYSTRAINLNAGYKPTVTDAGSQISFTAPNLINTTVGDFLTQGFRPGQVIEIVDGGASTQTAKYVTIDSLTASVITTVEATIVTEGVAIDTPTIRLAGNGMSWLDIFRYGVFCLYSSPMPSDINGTEGATMLAKLTDGGGAFTPGVSTNGLQFEFDAAGKISILSTQTWREDLGLSNADAYWGMFYDNAFITGDDSTNLVSPRIMGSVGLSGSGADIIVTTMAIKTTTPVLCSQFDLTLPGQACS